MTTRTRQTQRETLNTLDDLEAYVNSFKKTSRGRVSEYKYPTGATAEEKRKLRRKINQERFGEYADKPAFRKYISDLLVKEELVANLAESVGCDSQLVATIGKERYDQKAYRGLREVFRKEISNIKTIVNTMRQRGPRAGDKTGPQTFTGQWRVDRLGEAMRDYIRGPFSAPLNTDLRVAKEQGLALNNTLFLLFYVDLYIGEGEGTETSGGRVGSGGLFRPTMAMKRAFAGNIPAMFSYQLPEGAEKASKVNNDTQENTYEILHRITTELFRGYERMPESRRQNKRAPGVLQTNAWPYTSIQRIIAMNVESLKKPQTTALSADVKRSLVDEHNLVSEQKAAAQAGLPSRAEKRARSPSRKKTRVPKPKMSPKGGAKPTTTTTTKGGTKAPLGRRITTTTR